MISRPGRSRPRGALAVGPGVWPPALCPVMASIWTEQQMGMIRHQHVGVQVAVLRAQRLVEPVKMGLVVLRGKAAGRALVAALHDVQRESDEMKHTAAVYIASPRIVW